MLFGRHYCLAAGSSGRGIWGEDAKEFKGQKKREQRMLRVCFTFFLLGLGTCAKPFALLIGSMTSLSSLCSFPMRAQILVGLRVSLKLGRRQTTLSWKDLLS